MNTSEIRLTTVVADPACTYYVANKKGKNLSYTEVNAKSFIVVDKKGDLTLTTTVNGKNTADPELYIQKSEGDGVSRCTPTAYPVATRLHFNGRPLVDICLDTDLDTGHACIEYCTSDSDHYHAGDSVMNIKPGKYPVIQVTDHIVIDLGLEMCKDFIPVNDIGETHPEMVPDKDTYSNCLEHNCTINQRLWKRFFNGDGHKLIPSKKTADKALAIVKKALADIDKLGCKIFLDTQNSCAGVLRKTPDNLVLEQEPIDDHDETYSTIPMSALASVRTHIDLLDTNNDYSYYVKKKE